jgi:integrase
VAGLSDGKHQTAASRGLAEKVDLALKSKAHLKTLMHVLFNAAMRWEFIPYQHNPMSLVRVKDSSKRLREPKFRPLIGY